VKIGTVAALGGASPDGIPVAPARAGFVVTQCSDDVVVDGAGLGERVLESAGLLRRKFLNGSLEGNEAVGFEETLKIGRGRASFGGHGVRIERNTVLATGGFKRYADFGGRGELGGRNLNIEILVAILGVATLGIGERSVNLQMANGLVAIRLRQGNPHL
jgi:hypothetical protein